LTKSVERPVLKMDPALARELPVMAVTIKNKRAVGLPDAIRRNSGPPNPPAAREASDLVMQIIEGAKKYPMSTGELATENARLMAYGAKQAKKAGIKERDIPRVIHDSRPQRQPA
jgi:hypothetical protein